MRTYDEIAKAVGFELCGSCSLENTFSFKARRRMHHETGFFQIEVGHYLTKHVIHWRRRRVTKSGVKRFLMLASGLWQATQPPGHGKHAPTWFLLWNRIQWARRTARFALRIQIPPEAWRPEQAKLAAKIASAPPIYENQPSTAILRSERERAMRWARRRAE